MTKDLVFLLCLLGFSFHSNAQELVAPSPILFIYDASGSMWGQLQGKTKKQIASDVLVTAVNNLPENQNIGLMAYGHRSKGDCTDVELLVDLNNTSKAAIHSAIKDINPLGKTPLAFSATQAIKSLQNSKTRATIILITDGIESCDGNICDVVTAAKSEGIDFKLHIVGFGLKEDETEQLKCAANAGLGKYYDAFDASGLGEVLLEATSETIDDTPGNFTVFTVKNGKPVDGLIKAYERGSDQLIDAVRTYGDTAYLSLPPGKYDFKVSALENSRIEPLFITDIQSYDSKIEHQTIAFDAGRINLTTLNNGEGWDCTSKVINQDGKVVGGSRTYGRPRLIEVNPGIYNVEIEGMVMNGLETIHLFTDIKVKSGKTTDITHNFQTGKALLGVRSGDTLIDATINIKEKDSGKRVAGGRSYTSPSSNPKEYILNPGIYEVVVKAVKKEMAGKSEIFTIEVLQDKTTERMVNF